MYGKRGSRTLGSFSATSVFKTDALNHSATFPPLIVPQFYLKNKFKDILRILELRHSKTKNKNNIAK